MVRMQERWQEHVAAAREADMSLADYARRHGLKVRSLYRAKRKAKLEKTATRVRHPQGEASPLGAGAFVPVVLKAETNCAEDRAERLTLRAQLPNGVQLSWTHGGGDGQALSNVLQALAGLPCSN